MWINDNYHFLFNMRKQNLGKDVCLKMGDAYAKVLAESLKNIIILHFKVVF